MGGRELGTINSEIIGMIDEEGLFVFTLTFYSLVLY